MKKLLLAVGIALTVGAVNTASAESPADTPVDVMAASQTQDIPTIINDVAIPFKVVMYAQWEYQGYTIVQASKAVRNGQQVYNLRLSQDGENFSYSNVYLIYDNDWKLMGNEKIAPPPPKLNVERDEVDNDNSGTNRQEDNQGRGSDDNDDDKNKPAESPAATQPTAPPPPPPPTNPFSPAQ